MKNHEVLISILVKWSVNLRKSINVYAIASLSEDEDAWEDVEEEEDGEDFQSDEEYDSEGPLSDDSDFKGKMKEFLFMEEETKSRFTEYSMTSLVMKRNEQLTLLDERFEKVK